MRLSLILWPLGAFVAAGSVAWVMQWGAETGLEGANGGGLGVHIEMDARTNGDQPSFPPSSDLSPVLGDIPPVEPAPEVLRLDFLHLTGESPGTGTDFQFLPNTTEVLMTLREGKLAWVALANRTMRILSIWDFAEDMVIEDACGPSNIALDPAFAKNSYIYVTYCASTTKNRLVRYELDFDEGPRRPSVVLEIEAKKRELWRRFGSMGWEDENVLWLLVGDHAQPEQAQDPMNLLGSLVRIVPRRGKAESGYDAPPPRPWIESQDVEQRHDAVFAYGFRAPFRASRDSSGRFWVGDVGDMDFEEVNLVTASGQNFGWDLYSGPCGAGCKNARGPLVFYDRSDAHRFVTEEPGARPNASRSIWVGEMYEAPTIDRYLGLMDGVVAFGDMFTGMIRGLRVDQRGILTYNEPIAALSFVTQWRVGPDGYVYVLDLGGNMHVALLARD